MTNQNKVAVVTGASRGIGKAIAVHLARAGFDVVVAARTVQEGQVLEGLSLVPGSLEYTASEIKALGRKAHVAKLGLLNKRDIENVVEQTIKEFGRIDVMVNNAARFGREGSRVFVDTPLEAYEKEIQANVLGPLYFAKLVVPIMTDQGGGIIMNVTSEASRWDAVGVPLGYSMSKAGLSRQAQGLSKEFKELNISIINVEPGLVASSQLPDEIMDAALHIDVPGAVCAYLATHPHPMFFSGRVVDVPSFAVENKLVDGNTLPPLYGPEGWAMPERSPRPLNPWS